MFLNIIVRSMSYPLDSQFFVIMVFYFTMLCKIFTTQSHCSKSPLYKYVVCKCECVYESEIVFECDGVCDYECECKSNKLISCTCTCISNAEISVSLTEKTNECKYQV